VPKDDAPHRITVIPADNGTILPIPVDAHRSAPVVPADNNTILSTPVDAHRSAPTLAPSALINVLGPNPQCPQSMQESSRTPDTNFWPPNIVKLVKSSLRTDSRPQNAPLFVFKLSQEVAHRNYCLLKKFNMSIEKALGAQSNSPLGYGSEFKKAATLQLIIYRVHPIGPATGTYMTINCID
jgi:hypothetical protein